MRRILTNEEAVEIFLLKPARNDGDEVFGPVAKRFGVSAKTIKDIWSGRTWYN